MRTQKTAPLFHYTVNANLKTFIERTLPFAQPFFEFRNGVTPKEFYKLGMVPRPNSLKSFLALMKEGFNPEKSQGFKGCYQFIFSGEQEGGLLPLYSISSKAYLREQ